MNTQELILDLLISSEFESSLGRLLCSDILFSFQELLICCHTQLICLPRILTRKTSQGTCQRTRGWLMSRKQRFYGGLYARGDRGSFRITPGRPYRITPKEEEEEIASPRGEDSPNQQDCSLGSQE
ncbi:hypothetical protein LIER_05069 [Lithospermum erythrorhizon]|uniref:Uncharacterized protein n=1 Tax=Lithospermum erythrorhizon TaxID=34254 RepID=A0AAV3P3U2_LITER